MELKKIIEDINNDMEEINKMVEYIDQKQDLLSKYSIKIEFRVIK